MSELDIRELSVVRGGRSILSCVSLHAAAGAVTALIGPNGAGKSTTLKAVVGVVPAFGSLTVDGVDLRQLDPRRRAKAVAYVPQRSQLTAPVTCRDVVAMGRFAHGVGLVRLTGDDAAAVAAALRATDAEHLAERLFPDLSAGEQQRILIARALATGAGVIALDEPGANLDLGHIRALELLLRRLADDGRAILAVVHDPAQVLRLADHAALLCAGRVEARGAPLAVLTSAAASAAFGIDMARECSLIDEVQRRRLAADQSRVAPRPATPNPAVHVAPAAASGSPRSLMIANAFGAGLALVAAIGFALAVRPPSNSPGPSPTGSASFDRANAVLQYLPDGRAVVKGGDAEAVPVRTYQRIASLSIIADSLLPDLVAPERFQAASRWSVGPDAFRLGQRPRLGGADELEAILAQRPDLVVLNSAPGQQAALARLRAADIAVLDLGEARGLAHAVLAMRRLGAVVGNADGGERLARMLVHRMQAVSATLPKDRPRRTAIVLAPTLDKLYGSTEGTSAHDVLIAAGLIDAAAAAGFHDWPDYAPEQILALDPDRIVVPAGKASALRALPALASLRAIRDPAGVIEIDPGLLSNAGPLMADAAEALAAAAWR
ncbi:hypothetical protein LBMAG53_17850 [Planctomycetota bacterium]|nr:hypothetical protein LBMAG53_17850 [Planctomycetota bacterium]